MSSNPVRWWLYEWLKCHNFRYALLPATAPPVRLIHPSDVTWALYHLKSQELNCLFNNLWPVIPSQRVSNVESVSMQVFHTCPTRDLATQFLHQVWQKYENRVLYDYFEMTRSQGFYTMGAQLSLKAALPLAKILAIASYVVLQGPGHQHTKYWPYLHCTFNCPRATDYVPHYLTVWNIHTSSYLHKPTWYGIHFPYMEKPCKSFQLHTCLESKLRE